MVYLIKDLDEFKQQNLAEWKKNTNFWLKGRMRHLKDIYSFAGDLIQNIVDERGKKEVTLLDLGCGEGWIFRLINERALNINYIGADSNSKFIDVLNNKYGELDQAQFHCLDIEKPVPDSLIECADLITNFFNFFEISYIHAAFVNTCKMLKMNGSLLIASIDPVMQILSVSKNHKSFVKNLKKYEEHQTSLGYKKKIDVIGEKSNQRFYYGILYSMSTYVELAKQNNLVIEDYKEVIKTGNSIPQIYQFMVFRKV